MLPLNIIQRLTERKPTLQNLQTFICIKNYIFYCMCIEEQTMYGSSYYIDDIAAHPVLHLLNLYQ